jgi:cold shock CspA family protein
MQKNQERRTGTVVHVENQRGYFFIHYDGGRIFCHVAQWSELEMPLLNEQVSCEIGPARKPQYQFEAANARPSQSAGLKALIAPSQSEVRS